MSSPASPVSRAIFLSYASQDAKAARQICDSLRTAGIEVWFDTDGGLEHGDEWDQKIRRQIKECVFFMPLVSANTQARHEGYFRIEWELAAERAMGFAHGVPFVLPIVIDDTREPDALVPERFRKVQWTRLPGGVVPPEVLARFVKLWSHRTGALAHETARAEAAMVGRDRRTPPLDDAESAGFGEPVRPRRRSFIWFAAALVALLAGAVWWFSPRASPPPAAPAPMTKTGETKSGAASASPTAAVPAANEKSLVVLPLENLSPDPENAFFTDGMHAEIISTLGRIPDLRVISRNSTLAFKGGAVAIPEVGRRLGVANVMTGSVRREKSRVKIALELRRAGDEALLWSQTYERDLSDQFATQSEIANDVARALQIRTSSGTMQWARLFTTNPEAYDLFLKTLEIYNTPFGTGAHGLAMAEECVRRFEEVLRLDPNFSVATSYLSRAHNNAAGRSTDPVARARHAAEAKRLAEEFSKALPGGAGDGALANYYSNIENNFDRSMSYAQNVVRALPNDAAGYSYLGIALQGLGRYREAEATLRRALEIDPLTTTYWENLISSLARLRDEPKMEDAITRYVALTGSKASMARIIYARFLVRAEVPADLTQLESGVRRQLLWAVRRFAEERDECDRALATEKDSEFVRAGLLIDQCAVLAALGKDAELEGTKKNLAAFWEKWAEASPDQSVGVRDSLGAGVRATMGVGLQDNLGRLRAFGLMWLGRDEEAVAAIKARVESLNPKSEPRLLWYGEADAAAIYAKCGHKPEAVERLRHLLTVPSEITVPLLRASPTWDPLRDDPAFKALLADPKNSAPL